MLQKCTDVSNCGETIEK